MTDTMPVVQFGVAIATFHGYFLVFGALLARTPGKFATGMLIVDTEGERASWKDAVPRLLTRVLEVNPLLLGAIPAAILTVVSKNHQRLGDRWAGTLVVPKRRL